MNLCDLCPFVAFRRRTDGLVEPTPGVALPADFSHRRATMWHDESLVTNGNPIVHWFSATQMYAGLPHQAPPANLDSFTNAFWLQASTYWFNVLGATGPNRAIIDWKIDGVLAVNNQDWYNGAETPNVVQVNGAVVTHDGWHVLTGTVDGKHASSTAYYMTLTKYWFEPVSD